MVHSSLTTLGYSLLRGKSEALRDSTSRATTSRLPATRTDFDHHLPAGMAGHYLLPRLGNFGKRVGHGDISFQFAAINQFTKSREAAWGRLHAHHHGVDPVISGSLLRRRLHGRDQMPAAFEGRE